MKVFLKILFLYLFFYNPSLADSNVVNRIVDGEKVEPLSEAQIEEVVNRIVDGEKVEPLSEAQIEEIVNEIIEGKKSSTSVEAPRDNTKGCKKWQSLFIVDPVLRRNHCSQKQ